MLSEEWAAGESSMDILDKKGLINIQSKMEQDGSNFIMLLNMTFNIKFTNCVFIKFSTEYFYTW